MPEYEYRYTRFPKDETVWVPDDAICETVSTFGDMVIVRYLMPVEGGDD